MPFQPVLSADMGSELFGISRLEESRLVRGKVERN
jgi:hypothetical protein